MTEANAQQNLSESVEAEPAPEAKAPANKPLPKEVKAAPEPEPSEDPPTSARADTSEATPPRAESASLPLPNSVIARTIERIGYPCGSIVSSSRIEGASGSSDYRITCSSGASYRASNRTGRYRFSKAD